MVISCFKTRLSADFQECWSNKPGSNPHIYGQGDLFRQDSRERHLRMESKKLPVQLGVRERQLSNIQAQGTLPIPTSFGALPSLDYGCSVQTLEFSSSTANRTEQSSQIIPHRQKHEASSLPSRRDIYLSCLHPWISNPLYPRTEPIPNPAKYQFSWYWQRIWKVDSLYIFIYRKRFLDSINFSQLFIWGRERKKKKGKERFLNLSSESLYYIAF